MGGHINETPTPRHPGALDTHDNRHGRRPFEVQGADKMTRFKFSVFGSRLRMLAVMMGGFMFITGAKDFLPPIGSFGYMVFGLVLIWWGGWRGQGK